MSKHRNKNRPGYKKTKVGWIPEEWETSKLKKCCLKIGSGITPRGGESTYLDAGVAFVRSQNVLSGEFNPSGLKFISNAQNKKMRSSSLKCEDILFNITGASIGRCCMFPCNIGEANVNQHVCIVRLAEGHDAHYFMGVLNSKIARKQLYENQAGGGREGLNFQNLGAFTIPLPPLPEQKAIASVLECWDRAIHKYEEKIEKKKNIKKGLMQRLLSGKQRLPGFSGKWERSRFIDLVHLQRGFDLPHKERKQGNIPVYASNGLIGYHNVSKVCGPGIVTGRSGSIGKVSFVQTDFWPLNTTLFVTDFKTNDPLYAFYFMNNLKLERLANGTGVPTLNRNDVHPQNIVLPPLTEQKAIASILSSADSEIKALEKKLAVVKEQKKFLLNNLVTGTIRLPEFSNEVE